VGAATLNPQTLALDHLRSLPPEELADLLLGLDAHSLAQLVARFGQDEVAELLAELDSQDAARLLLKLSRAQAADVLEEMPPDDAADVLEELPPHQAETLLTEMEQDRARALKGLLAYPPGTAGSLMTPECIVVRPDLTAQEALAVIRRAAEDAETVHYVYVTDPDTQRLLGVLSLYKLVFSRPDTLVRDLMTRDVVKVRADAPQEEAARLVQRHDFVSLPVVDAEDRLLGIITVDDVLDVIREEFTEDYARLVGTDAEAMARRSPLEAARLRLPWLLVTLGVELCAGFVISRFDEVLTRVILLASFMPIISAISGNVGLQAAAIVVRGLDTGHVTLKGWWAAVRKEAVTAAVLAVVVGSILGTIGVLWSGRPSFGLVIGAAQMTAMLTAGLMGTLFPLVSKRLGFDPATTAGPFETAFQDVVGFAVFLWLASQLLHFLE
jgi:magnesium transporter